MDTAAARPAEGVSETALTEQAGTTEPADAQQETSSPPASPAGGAESHGDLRAQSPGAPAQGLESLPGAISLIGFRPWWLGP